MRQKGYVEPFSLFRNQLVALEVNRSIDQCLHRLMAVDTDPGQRSRSEYTLVTDVHAPRHGSRIKCTFFFNHDPAEGFRIQRMRISLDGAQQVRRIHHNAEIPNVNLLSHLFPQRAKWHQTWSPYLRRGS